MEVLGKIEAGLKMPVIRSDKQRSTSRSPGKEERRVRRMSPGDEERKEKRNKRKVCSLPRYWRLPFELSNFFQQDRN